MMIPFGDNLKIPEIKPLSVINKNDFDIKNQF